MFVLLVCITEAFLKVDSARQDGINVKVDRARPDGINVKDVM